MKTLRSFSSVLFLVGSIGVTSLSCHAAPVARSREVGAEAPAIELTALAGDKLKLTDHKGKVVLLDFWATWCKPCQTQALILEDILGELKDKNVAFFALNSGEDRETVESFVAKKPFGYPVLLDPEDHLSLSWQIAALPTVVILGKDGKIAFFREGLVDGPTLREELKKAGA